MAKRTGEFDENYNLLQVIYTLRGLYNFIDKWYGKRTLNLCDIRPYSLIFPTRPFMKQTAIIYLVYIKMKSIGAFFVFLLILNKFSNISKSDQCH